VNSCCFGAPDPILIQSDGTGEACDRRSNCGGAGRIDGVVVACRSKSMNEWSPREQFRLWLLLGTPWSPFRLLFGMLLRANKPTPRFHLHGQRVLAPFEFLLVFELADAYSQTRADGNQETREPIAIFLMVGNPGHSDWFLGSLQCSGLGRFWLFDDA